MEWGGRVSCGLDGHERAAAVDRGGRRCTDGTTQLSLVSLMPDGVQLLLVCHTKRTALVYQLYNSTGMQRLAQGAMCHVLAPHHTLFRRRPGPHLHLKLQDGGLRRPRDHHNAQRIRHPCGAAATTAAAAAATRSRRHHFVDGPHAAAPAAYAAVEAPRARAQVGEWLTAAVYDADCYSHAVSSDFSLATLILVPPPQQPTGYPSIAARHWIAPPR